MSKNEFMMAGGAVPDKINEALKIIWDYSEDSFHSVYDKMELEENHGLHVTGDECYCFFSFAWSCDKKT